MEVTAEAHPNIALVKYWGKADSKLNTPIHGSLSATLDFGKTTTITQYSDSNEFSLNGKPAEITHRLERALSIFESKSNRKFLVQSQNSFPTAAGFASSAAGSAAFVTALAALVGETENPIEFWEERNLNLSAIARQVSGSGARSMYGGFVEWLPGNNESSIAHCIQNEVYWPDFVAISIVIQSKAKTVPSSEGMQRTVQTVPWIHERANSVVPKRIQEAKQFIDQRDFQSLSEIIMRESNELHANCLASYPPIHYLTDSSFEVINAIHTLNQESGRNVAAYSFDAGPNPFIFTSVNDLNAVQSALSFIPETAITVSHLARGAKAMINQ